VAHDTRIGGLHQDERHLVRDGVEAVLQNFQEEGIDFVFHDCCSSAITMLPASSIRAPQLGGTTVVPSYSSMISGPPRNFSSSASRGSTGVTSSPCWGPK